MRISLSSASPPRIEDASNEWLEHFGFELPACRGRTLSLVLGPDSNPATLSSLVDTALSGKRTQARLVLYAASGAGSLFHVHARPTCDQQFELALTRCDALASFEDAAQEDGVVKVLVHAKRPFRVAHVSAAFASTYGLAPEQLANRTLGLIQGPGTDVNAWTKALDGALAGARTSTCVQTYTCNGSEVEQALTEVNVTPVIGGGDVGYLLIAMGHTHHCVQDSVGAHSAKRPSKPLTLSEGSAAHGAQRKVTFSDDTRNHCYQLRRLRPVARPVARSPAAPKRQATAPKRQATAHRMKTVRMACSKLQKHRASQHSKTILNSNRIPLRHARVASLLAALASIMMTISSILTLTSYCICKGLWTSRSSTPPSAVRSHKAASQSRSRAAEREAAAYRRDCQQLQFLEMSDSQLADFSPY